MTDVKALDEGTLKWMAEAKAMMAEPLDEELQGYVEDSDTWGPMLRHPLVYMIPLVMPGQANQTLRYKQQQLSEAEAEQDWHKCVFLHERAYRLEALIDYCTGRGEDWGVLPLVNTPHNWNLAADVWVDSENIQQNIEDWRALFDNGANGLWLGTDEEREEFDALPTIPHKDGPVIRAWRGGSVGDWSWTTDIRTAEFFSARSGLPVRGHLIPVADVFGYLTRRSEAELLVKFTEFRRSLVYP